MKRLAPTLSLLALAGAYASAEVVSDDAVKITVTGIFQPRMDVGHGSTVASPSGDTGTYNPAEGVSGNTDTADFYFRRMRIGVKGTFMQDWVFQATMAADYLGRTTGSAPANTGSVNLSFYDAFAGRKFAMGSVTHTVVAGKQPIWASTAASRGTTGLFPTSRASAGLFGYNGTGVAYRLDAPIIRAGIDVQNNSGDDNANQTNTYGEGLLTTGRIEITGPGDWAAPWQESYAGKPGTGFVIGLDLGLNKRDRVAGPPVASVDTALYGAEAVLHIDGLSALVDFRSTVATNIPDTAAAETKTRAYVAGIQAGYAFPLGSTGFNLEPAARAQRIEGNADATGQANWGTAEYGASGRQFEVGVNIYFGAGHKNKLGIEYIRWVGEDQYTATDADPATANIVRVQHQLWF